MCNGQSFRAMEQVSRCVASEKTGGWSGFVRLAKEVSHRVRQILIKNKILVFFAMDSAFFAIFAHK